MKGILFKPDMYKAIREGRKTQTRRVIKEIKNPDSWVFESQYQWFRQYRDGGLSASTMVVKPRYQVGEVVYIKETWWTSPENRYEIHNRNMVSYRAIIVENAGEDAAKRNRWLPTMFMPAWAARDFIKITDVRPERLQEITLADIYAEGCPLEEATIFTDPMSGYETKANAYEWYGTLWDSINPKFPWSSNPWVWRYEFKLEPKGE